MKLKTFTYADVSTCHISKEDRDRLHEFALEEVHGGSAPITVAEYQYGFFISVPGEMMDKEELETLREELGFSDALLALMAHCSDKGIHVIRLDADAHASDDLPKFDW